MIKLYLDSSEENFLRRIRYITGTLLNIAGILPDNDISIYYGQDFSKECDVMIKQGSPAGRCGFPADMCELPAGIHEFPVNACLCPSCRVLINDDILEKAFDLITCSREYKAGSSGIGRDSAKNGNCWNPDIPCVNHYAAKLSEGIGKAARNKNILLKTAQRKFTVVLSHDVDNLTDKNLYVFLHRIKEGLKIAVNGNIRGGLGHALFAAGRLFGRGNAYQDFEKYMELEEGYGLKSTFFFMSGGNGRYGARYKMSEVKDIIKKIEAPGWEAALHTSCFSFDNPDGVGREKRRLEDVTGKEILGCRNHYLKFAVPGTWKVLKKSGLVYDTTLGFSDRPFFRAGTAYPFYPYDLNEEKVIDILEIPMVIMDSALLLHAGNISKAFSITKKILDDVRKINGTIAVNFHTGIFCSRDFPGWADIYIMILKYIKDYNGRGVTARQVHNESAGENQGYFISMG